MTAARAARLTPAKEAVFWAVLALLLWFLADLSWNMLLEQQRIASGPLTPAIIEQTYARRSFTDGRITYEMKTAEGYVVCHETLELGRASLGFQQGQTIEIVIGDRCGQALSVNKRRAPWSFFGLFVVLSLAAFYLARRIYLMRLKEGENSQG